MIGAFLFCDIEIQTRWNFSSRLALELQHTFKSNSRKFSGSRVQWCRCNTELQLSCFEKASKRSKVTRWHFEMLHFSRDSLLFKGAHRIDLHCLLLIHCIYTKWKHWSQPTKVVILQNIQELTTIWVFNGFHLICWIINTYNAVKLFCFFVLFHEHFFILFWSLLTSQQALNKTTVKNMMHLH